MPPTLMVNGLTFLTVLAFYIDYFRLISPVSSMIDHEHIFLLAVDYSGTS